MSNLTAADLLFGKNNERPVFDDRKQIKSWIQSKLIPLGILIVIERSDDSKIVFKCKSYKYSSSFKKIRQKRISKKKKMILQKQGLLDTFEMQQKLKQKKLKSDTCSSCPFRIRANFSIRLNKWSIVIVNGEHNHPLKNCRNVNGDFFNDESFTNDIKANLVKKRFSINPVEPEMIEEDEEEFARRSSPRSSGESVWSDGGASSSSNSSSNSSSAGLTYSSVDDLMVPDFASYDSPFFEPVKDEMLDLPVDAFIDEFFNKKGSMNVGNNGYSDENMDEDWNDLSNIPISTFINDCPALY